MTDNEAMGARTPLTYGGVFAVAEPPARPTSLWGRIAVVNRPGWPLAVDPHCARNTIYLISNTEPPQVIGTILREP